MPCPPAASFALIVPAHNEEAVIAQLIENLQCLRYPRHLYDIFVVADNCSDATAGLARRAGAVVFERSDPVRRGKGHALEYAFRRLAALPRRYDAYAVFDADNLVDPGFLNVMNACLHRGDRLIQGRIETKNPDDGWVAASFAMSYWISNRFWSLARTNFSLSSLLGGTGMCIKAGLLRKLGWGATSLTEDLEFTAKALVHGVPTVWAHEAVVYDEKPLTFRQSWRQRLRWVRGQAQVARAYLPSLVREGLRRADPIRLEMCLVLLRPFYVVGAALLGGASWLLGRLFPSDPFLFGQVPMVVWWLPAAAQVLLPLLAVGLDRVPLRPLRYLPLFPFFNCTWVPLTVVGVFSAWRRSCWSPTRHTRGISYQELLRQRGQRAAALGPEEMPLDAAP